MPFALPLLKSPLSVLVLNKHLLSSMLKTIVVLDISLVIDIILNSICDTVLRKIKREQYLIKIKIDCNIINVFNVTFDQFNALITFKVVVNDILLKE